MIILNKVIINLYLMAMILSIYLPIKDMALYLLLLCDIYFFTLFMVDLKNKNFRINPYVALILLALIISIIMSGQYAYYAIINILVICGIYYIVEFDSKYLVNKLATYIFISSFINAYLYYTIQPSYEGGKLVGDVLIERVELSFLPLSVASLIALIAFILSDSLKNTFLMYMIKLVNLALIFKLGKLSTILTLIAVYLSVFLLRMLYRKGAKYVIDVFLILLYAMFFLSSFVIFVFKDHIPANIITLLTRRDQIYTDFINYTLDNYGLLYGNGFINNFVHVSGITTSAHNQYLHIFFVLGVFGLVVFFLFFVKILRNTTTAIEKGCFLPFKIFFTISILMTMDNYFILTTFPLSMLFMMVFLLNVYPVKNNLKY